MTLRFSRNPINGLDTLLIRTFFAAFMLQFAAVSGMCGETVERISADTVRIHRLDSHITVQDTGAIGRKTGCGMNPVFMSHRLHHDSGKIACVTCHHKNSNDARTKECAQCHKGVDGLDKMHRVCGDCHQRRRQDMSCTFCHRDSSSGIRPKSVFGNTVTLSRVRFTHAKHLTVKNDCQGCHAGKSAQQWERSDNYPAMSTCLVCHNSANARKNCSSCHRDLERIKPVSHRHQWLSPGGHGEQSLFDRAACDQCHNARECNQCHLGQTAFKIHPAGYKFMHGIRVKSGAVNCEMCHRSRLSCAKCHERRQ